ncbi:4155_t:CDS:2 [Gigaspora rosea]|nr:4155_t:CDS:2 [Gigaspora rosea]
MTVIMLDCVAREKRRVLENADQEVNKILKKHSTLKDVTNIKSSQRRSPKNVIASTSSKKQRVKNLDTTSSSKLNVNIKIEDLLYKINFINSATHSEAYKSVAFEEVAIKDLQPFKPSEVPKLVQDYLCQSWFNGLMEVFNETLELVFAVDTSKNNYLADYMPDISLINKNDAADGAFVPKYINTVIELKKTKSAFGLADNDKGQLRIMCRDCDLSSNGRPTITTYNN